MLGTCTTLYRSSSRVGRRTFRSRAVFDFVKQ